MTIYENEALRAERDPVKYEAQKAVQREQYAKEIATTEGRDVRSYLKIEVAQKMERDVIRKERDAKRQAEKRASATQEQKDARADTVWKKRAEKRGLTSDQIAEGMAKRIADRKSRPCRTL